MTSYVFPKRNGSFYEWAYYERPQWYRSAVGFALTGKRGKAILSILAKEMNRMPTKRLISGCFTNKSEHSALGLVLAAKNIDKSTIDYYEGIQTIALLVDVAPTMVGELLYTNDLPDVTPEDRWTRMNQWVEFWLGYRLYNEAVTSEEEKRAQRARYIPR